MPDAAQSSPDKQPNQNQAEPKASTQTPQPSPSEAAPSTIELSIGVDTGGTFTDVILQDSHGQVVGTHKLLSTPHDPAEAVLHGIAHVLNAWQDQHASANTEPQPLRVHVTHGSTVATNALIEHVRRGQATDVAFVTTQGAEDTLTLARQHRPDLYAPVADRGPRPVAASACIGVAERLSVTGDTLTPLTPDAIQNTIDRVAQCKPLSVAVSLLHAHTNPVHETQLVAALREAFPNLPITSANALMPESREFERAATAWINAAMAPKMARYLSRLRPASLADSLQQQTGQTFPHVTFADLRIMGSEGGTIAVDLAIAEPVRTVLSGPAGGVRGTPGSGSSYESTPPNKPAPNRTNTPLPGAGVVTLDMGGTSTDTALVIDGHPTKTLTGHASGLPNMPVGLPMVAIEAVGAGGGSIAWVDDGGALRVGPHSAGADPGPVCYGRGGQDVTVTDAHVVLGHLGPNPKLAGRMALDVQAAKESLQHLAEQLNLSIEATAEGILQVAEATMAQAIKRISLEKGHDLRSLTLCPFGGAGGLHACRIAEQLGMQQVILPAHPGLLSAKGMLKAPAMWSGSQACLTSLNETDQPHTHAAIEQALSAIRQRLLDTIARENFDASKLHWQPQVDLRYAGQTHPITVDYQSPEQAALAFHDAHTQRFGHRLDARIETVAARLNATTPDRDSKAAATEGDNQPDNHTNPLPTSDANQVATGWPVYDRSSLPALATITGPAILTEDSATCLIPPGWQLTGNPSGTLVISKITNSHTTLNTNPSPLGGGGPQGRRGQAKALDDAASTHRLAPPVASQQLPRGGSGSSANNIDGATLSVYRHLYASVAEEMGVRLKASAFSPNIKERLDYSCALFDAKGRMVAQAAHIPVHLGSTPASVEAILKAFPPDTMRPGDQFVVNDPYAGGTHLPDITVVAPVFVEGLHTPAFYVCNRAHHADIGGLTPGSMPISDHIDHEGIRIPPSKLTPVRIENIAQASRTADERRGDLYAQVAALNIGNQRLQDLCNEHSLPRLLQAADALIDYADHRIQAMVEAWPDGTWRFTDYLDNDGFGQDNIAIDCTLTIDGAKATFDFTQSADQVTGPVNAVRSIVLSAVHYVLRVLAGDSIPANAGVMRSIDVLTRPGSVVDALPPRPVAGGNVETSQRLVDTLFGVLAQVVPDAVPAASCGSMNNLTIGGTHPGTGKPFAYYETLAGGAGAMRGQPGGHAVHTHMTNTLNTPIEAIEAHYPFRIVRYAQRTGSGGAGQFPGGDGVVRVYQFDAPATVTLLTERRHHQPYGLQGGQPGAPGKNVLIRDGVTMPLAAKCSFEAFPGDQLQLHTPGGGGWGRGIVV